MPAPLRVALAGYGYIAHYHARAARSAEGVELVGVMGRDPDKRAAFAEAHGCALRFEDEGALCASPDVDIVVNALPNSLHAPLSIAAMQAGKHVLVEKPMAMDAGEARAMLETSAATGARLLVGHMWRFDPEALWLRDRIAAGELGRVVKTKGYGVHVNWGPSGWFVDPALAGGGAFADMGVHALDTVRFLLGDPEPIRVYAHLETAYGDYDVDDLGVVVVTWDSGAISIIESGWWNPQMDGPEASTQLYGTEGYGRLFPTAAARTVDWKPQPIPPPTFPARSEHCDQSIYDGQLAHLVEAIREGRDPIPGPAHGLAVMRISDAAYRSAREGRAIDLA